MGLITQSDVLESQYLNLNPRRLRLQLELE
jgi:hypothetical protein